MNRHFTRDLHMLCLQVMETEIRFKNKWADIERVVMRIDAMLRAVEDDDFDSLAPQAQIMYGWLYQRRDALVQTEVPSDSVDEMITAIEEFAND